MFRNILILFVCMVITKSSLSQALDFRDMITGKPILLPKEDGVTGSPFLFDEWRKGKVMLADKRVYDNLELRFDLRQNRFFYNHNDSLYEFIDDVSEIRLHDPLHAGEPEYDMVFRHDISVDNPDGKYVQILSAGKIKLVKSYTKIVEAPSSAPSGYGYGGSDDKSKKLVLKTSQWAVKDNHVIPVKYSSSTLKDLTSDKKPEVEVFLDAKKLNPKKEMDFVVAVSYYNLLSK